ncbi:chemotaxis-specific protein-glutamate methyltransferase CheB [Thermovirga sp.]|uniref:chemotaxis-specific protein-glutamate methyltransferase CheB n=1 Tax=Thermovirga sp. TaxID=2699834 RepID=UPI0025EB84C0|nr:chemotaxis-specific protein-glutamate methyltransferase CheB [Thermovirga sp.]MBO8154494.1 chemotaxis-specific protein-glutamate methyltransferase CheB [Thermovirga sp.]
MIKLLIVDDSALMRRLLTELFEQEGDFEIRQARNGEEAVRLNLDFQPDIITLDVNMPGMDGITALSLIMAERPVPVIMVSSLTEKGALVTLEALNLGAVDYVLKPGGTISLSIDEIKDELISKVRAVVKAKVRKKERAGAASTQFAPKSVSKPAGTAAKISSGRQKYAEEGLVVIGASTGGPRTLEDILVSFPADFPWPILVAQHMPPLFTSSFAKRLDGLCPLNVIEVTKPMEVMPGAVYLAKGGADMVVTRRVGKLMAVPKPENPKYLWHPAVDLLGWSVLEHCDPKKVIAVLLTGMGYDGAESFAEIKRRGGRTIAESEESAIVFGMPKELIEKDGATLILPAEKIASQVKIWIGREVKVG